MPQRPILAIGGWMTSGKDAFADRLVDKHGWTKLAMGELILEMMLIENPWILVTKQDAAPLGQRIAPGFHRAADIIGHLDYVTAKTIVDFREYMQRLGDAARTVIGPDTWSDAMSRRLDRLIVDEHRIVFTGTRFPNELGMFLSRGATSIWVDRPGVEAPVNAHKTELGLTREAFDENILNDGTLADLYVQADAFAARFPAAVGE